MTGNRFKYIISSLSFTDLPPTYFKEKFFEVHHMVVSWNEYMKDAFIPSWVSSLDESVFIWTNKLT